MDKSVAVIIPCGGDHTKCIDQAVGSCLNADPPPEEIVVVDDCSSPPVGTLLATMDEKVEGLRLCTLLYHRGRSYARNYGVGMSDAPWLFFLDADDLLEPTAIEDFRRVLNGHSRADIIYADYDYLKENGARERVAKVPWRQNVKPLSRAVRNPANIGMFVKRDRFCLIGGFDEEMSMAEYWDFFLRYVVNPSIHVHKHHRPFFVARTLSTGGQRAEQLLMVGSRKVHAMVRGGYYNAWRQV